MKKITSVVLLLALIISLVGCGSSKEASQSDNSKEAAVQEKEEYQFEIEDFDAFMENKKLNVKVKIRNLTDKDIEHPSFNYQLLDENGDALASTSLSLDTILAGQAAWKTINISSYNEDIDFAEMKGICFVRIGYKDNYDLPFGGCVKYSFEDYIKSVTTEIVSCKLGDTVETDTVKVTVSEYFYKDEAVGKITQLAKIMPDDGEIWACIGLTLENISKNQVEPYKVLNASIDYNNGYTYSTDESTSVILSYPDFDAYYYKAGGISMKLSPLNSAQYILLISCSPKLQEDKSGPINVALELPDESGTKTFVYKMQ